MKIVINRTGHYIFIDELQKVLPADGKPYILPDNVAIKLCNGIEMIDTEKDKKIAFLENKINNLEYFVNSFKEIHTINDKLFKNAILSKKYTFDFLYSYCFSKDKKEASLHRFKKSIESIIKQDVRVCVCNTSDFCIYNDIKKLGKIEYIHEPLTTEFCKSYIINYGVEKMIRSDYFILSDIDLLYNNNFVMGMKKYLFSKEPVRVVFFNMNLRKGFDPINYADAFEKYKDNQDTTRTCTWSCAHGNGLIHLESFKKIGGYCEKFILYGAEDQEFNYRIKFINKLINDTDESLKTFHLYHQIGSKEAEIKNSVIYEQTKQKIDDYLNGRTFESNDIHILNWKNYKYR